jgi:hypothetical protein
MSNAHHWSDAKIALACKLRASFWSLGAISVVMGHQRRTVSRRFAQLRAQDDVRIQHADFIRGLAVASGAEKVTVATAQEYLDNEGFAAGLLGALDEDAA